MFVFLLSCPDVRGAVGFRRGKPWRGQRSPQYALNNFQSPLHQKCVKKREECDLLQRFMSSALSYSLMLLPLLVSEHLLTLQSSGSHSDLLLQKTDGLLLSVISRINKAKSGLLQAENVKIRKFINNPVVILFKVKLERQRERLFLRSAPIPT